MRRALHLVMGRFVHIEFAVDFDLEGDAGPHGGGHGAR